MVDDNIIVVRVYSTDFLNIYVLLPFANEKSPETIPHSRPHNNSVKQTMYLTRLKRSQNVFLIFPSLLLSSYWHTASAPSATITSLDSERPDANVWEKILFYCLCTTRGKTGDTVRLFPHNVVFLMPMTNIAFGNKCLLFFFYLFRQTLNYLLTFEITQKI